MDGASKGVVPDRLNAPLDGGPAGDAGARANLQALSRQLRAARATQAAIPHMKRGVALSQSGKFDKAKAAASKAVEIDPTMLVGWHLLGIACEKTGDMLGALEAYERGLALDPENPPIANDLGRLAMKLGMLDQAEALFRYYLSHNPNTPESANNLGCVLRNQMRFDEAIAILKPALEQHPDRAILWITLGTVVGDMGDVASAAAFYQEAARLDPKNPKAGYNLGLVRYSEGAVEEAIALYSAALPHAETPADGTMIRFGLALAHLARGDLAQGWEYYRGRLEPTYHEPIHFVTTRPAWTPGDDVAGRHLMLYGEQGLGDEIMLAGVLPDLLQTLGPGGRLTAAVTDRLLPLFRRSFPEVTFGAHKTIRHKGHNIRSAPFVEDWADIDSWAPLAEPLRQFRPSVESFPDRTGGYMKADPARVEHWRDVLSGLPGMKVGLLWTSLVVDTHRQRYFGAFEQWEPLLRTPGVTFVNLQYGDRSADLAMAREQFGVEIVQPQGIDLKNDLDDVAALSCALDLVLGISNATFNIAAACGVPAWLVSARTAWTKLGTDRYPWYPQVRAFQSDDFNDWSAVMGEMAAELARFAGGAESVRAAG
jgi:tetratricopeptide (TPR) repeat protein